MAYHGDLYYGWRPWEPRASTVGKARPLDTSSRHIEAFNPVFADTRDTARLLVIYVHCLPL
jgi:hypothetical protein